MRKHKLEWTLAIFALFIVLTVTTSAFAQKNPLIKLPSGNWTFGVSPYHGSDKQDFPVVVGQVTSEIDVGVGATKIGIVNNSNKTVAAVRFRWLLFQGEERNAILQQGNTPLLALRTPLAPDNKRILLYQVVSLLKVYRPLLKDDNLDGDFQAEVFVDEVYFTDGSTWQKDDKQVKQVSKQNKSDLKIIPASLAQCSKQKCKSNTAGTGGTVYYSCEASTFNEHCSVTDGTRRCTNIACGFGGGGGIEEETPIDYYP